MVSDLKRYELFGWDYEHINPIAEREVAWYLRFARKTGGPVLELACGTCRLLAALAGAGFEVAGIDLSAGMIKIAGERISRLPPDTTSRISLHNADMTHFQLDRQFGLVIIADNSFCELGTRQQQMACLEGAHRHLRPGGKLLVTVRRFDRSEFEGKKQVPGWSSPVNHPMTHEPVMRRVEKELVGNGERIRTVVQYRTVHGDGSESLEECVSEAPVMLVGDYASLFCETGFSSRAFIDYEDRGDDGLNPTLCFVCDRA